MSVSHSTELQLCVVHQSFTVSDEDPNLQPYQCLFLGLIRCFSPRDLYFLGHKSNTKSRKNWPNNIAIVIIVVFNITIINPSNKTKDRLKWFDVHLVTSKLTRHLNYIMLTKKLGNKNLTTEPKCRNYKTNWQIWHTTYSSMYGLLGSERRICLQNCKPACQCQLTAQKVDLYRNSRVNAQPNCFVIKLQSHEVY